MIPRKLSAYVLVLLMTTTAFAFVSWPANASEGDADAYGYTWTDSNSPNPAISFNWIDISGTGGDVEFSYGIDVSSGLIEFGFDFPFYGDSYSGAQLCSDGFLTFNSPSFNSDNREIPNASAPNNIIAPFWDNLMVNYSFYNYGTIYYETIGVAPDRQFVAQWNEVSIAWSYTLMTFELILNETGEIWFQYLSMNGIDGSSATVGIESDYGDYGCEYSYNEASLSDGLAIMFELGPIGFGPDQESYGDPGTTIDYQLSIMNNGPAAESYDIELHDSDLGWAVEILDDSSSPLADTNGNGIPDTGDLTPGIEFYFFVSVDIPDSPSARFETTVMIASAYSDPSVNDTVTLVTETVSMVYASPHSDYGYDTDSDGDYDYLVVNMSIRSFVEQDIHVYADLYSPSGSSLDADTGVFHVAAGFSNISLYFSAEDIFMAFENGSYDVTLRVYDSAWIFMGYEYYSTSSYNYDEFDPIGALFHPSPTDYGLDSDADSYYDVLVVNITLMVYKEGYYTVEMNMFDQWSYMIAYIESSWYLSPGEIEVQMSVTGLEIYDSGLDGPYHLHLYLYVDNSTYLDFDEYDTSAYGYADFDGPDIAFAPPHEDYAADTDSDFYYNEVVIEVYIDCLSAGYYDLIIHVYDYSYYEFEYIDETLYFDVGTSTYYVVLDSTAILLNGVAGRFYLTMYLVNSSTSEELDFNYYSTSYYYLDDFDPLEASFYAPHDDYGRDDDGDDLYDVLVFSINVQASYDGWFYISAYIYDPYWNSYFVEMTVHLEQDVLTVVEIELDSYSVWDSGYDGGWYIEMYLYDYYSYTYYDGYAFSTDGYYYVEDFDPLPAIFGSPHDDYALDVDDDSLYDYLYVEVIVDCYETGEYTIRVDLFDPWGYYITTVSVTESMNVGLHAVSLEFAGWMMEISGRVGNYYLEMELLDEHGYELDYDEYYTDYYYYYDFASVPAEFTAPYSDYAVDSDDDTLYEYLVVVASVEVYVSGEYKVYGLLHDDYSNHIDVTFSRVALDEGVSVVELWFDAWPIAYDVWGPYYVELTLTDIEDNTMDETTYYLESDYHYYDFDPTAPSIDSGWAYDSPVIDGTVSEDEWFGAAVIDLVAADSMNAIDAMMYIMNDGEFLYILIDATGDTTETYGDVASVAFDTGDDGIMTHGHEDQFVLIAAEMGPESYHFVYDAFSSDWEVDCSPFDELLTDHDGLAGAIGFGSSPDSTTDHRIYELSIPLELLMISSGDSIGFAGLSDMAPAVMDAVDDDYSTWPVFFWDVPELVMYGTLTLSEEPPLTTVELDGTLGEGDWYVSAVEVTLTATGGMGGVNATYYSLDGGDWIEYTDAFTVSTQRSHTLQYYSDDVSGNEEPVRTAIIGIDWTAPTASASTSGTEGDNDWFVSEATISLSGSDGSMGSGIATLKYRLDGGSWTNYTSAISIGEDGEHTIEFFAIDVAGNEGSMEEITVKVDATIPETVASVDGSTVTLTASDDTSGVNVTMYRIDGGEWMVYTSPFKVSGSGNHTVEFYSTDNAGNADEISIEYVEVTSGIFGLDAAVFFVLMALLAIIVAIVIVVLLVMRKKNKGAGPSVFHEQSPPPYQVDGSPPVGPDQGLPPPPEQ